MLTSIKIKNFRLFESLEVKRLGRVTLLVGKNNFGKSSFLEALLLYLNEPSFFTLQDLVSCRQDHSFLVGEYQLFERPVKHLFYKHMMPLEGEEGIHITGNKGNSPSLHIHVTKEKEEDSKPFLIGKCQNKKGVVVWSEDFEVDQKKKNKVISPSGNLVRGTFFANLFKGKFQFVPTMGIPDWVASVLWEQVNLTDLQGNVIDTLKFTEPDLEKIVFITFPTGAGTDRLPMAVVKGFQEPITLKTLGDGVTKLFHILISIANAKDGTLLIDEFENGFHWSVQEKVWTAVFDLAEKLNVQVFATTHSRDCVQAFSKVWSDNEEAGAFIRLENNEGVVRAQEYTAEILSDSIETSVEVR